ncbi:MAG: hydrogenase accessory protein HypB [Cellvibrionaceae bacterium]|nr:hydrogenase accessory protein HypB [Cellvibrionaceae bacterium]|tara:strand:- start:6793 stop:7575 length:783 start_codon:yes stop_codon:yes gene_type:complete
MCNTCGCDANDHQHKHHAPSALVPESAELYTAILQPDEIVAARNRQQFEHHRVLVVNLMSSPGSGKTQLIEQTIQTLNDEITIAVIEGDLDTENDALRIRRHGVQAEQITTGTACHLDAAMIETVLPRFSLDTIDILFIENVGNLICPACFDLGQDVNVVLLSVPEGDDKPEKYPVMFRAADLMLITKTDYLPVATTFSIQRATQSFRNVGGRAPVQELAAPLDRGVSAWIDWLLSAYAQKFTVLSTPSPSETADAPPKC